MKDNNISEELLKQVNGGGSGESGGAGDGSDPGSGNVGMIISTTTKYCPTCRRKTVFNVYTGGRTICTGCFVGPER